MDLLEVMLLIISGDGGDALTGTGDRRDGMGDGVAVI